MLTMRPKRRAAMPGSDALDAARSASACWLRARARIISRVSSANARRRRPAVVVDENVGRRAGREQARRALRPMSRSPATATTSAPVAARISRAVASSRAASRPLIDHRRSPPRPAPSRRLCPARCSRRRRSPCARRRPNPCDSVPSSPRRRRRRFGAFSVEIGARRQARTVRRRQGFAASALDDRAIFTARERATARADGRRAAAAAAERFLAGRGADAPARRRSRPRIGCRRRPAG